MGQGGVDGLFSIDNEDRVILGRAGEVILLLPPVADALALPPTAIYGQQRVYAVQDERLKTIMIERLGEVLMENGERWQLVKGDIAPGTQILTSQLPDAVGGLAVQTEATPNE